jgi:hypothetical protein
VNSCSGLCLTPRRRSPAGPHESRGRQAAAPSAGPGSGRAPVPPAADGRSWPGPSARRPPRRCSGGRGGPRPPPRSAPGARGGRHPPPPPPAAPPGAARTTRPSASAVRCRPMRSPSASHLSRGRGRGRGPSRRAHPLPPFCAADREWTTQGGGRAMSDGRE